MTSWSRPRRDETLVNYYLRSKLADIAYNMVSGATVPNIGSGGSQYNLIPLNSPTFTTMIYAGRSANAFKGNRINKALQTTSNVANLASSPFIFSCILQRDLAAVAGQYPTVYSQRLLNADQTETQQLLITVNGVDDSIMFLRKTSGTEASATLTAPSIGVPVCFIAGLGSDKKVFLCINGNCAIASVSLPSFFTTLKKLTIGGYADLSNSAMFGDEVGEMAWWKNVSGTAAELAAKAVQRNTDYAAGNITSDNYMYWRGL